MATLSDLRNSISDRFGSYHWGGGYTPPGSTPIPGLSGEDANAYSVIVSMLKEYGLDSLAPKILDYIQKGYSSDTISLELQDTTEWKTRFAANDDRRKAGLPVLSPQEYIATERAYRQIMSSAGLPPGFYDQTTDFRQFLAKDVSPQEIQSRVSAVSDFINRGDPQQLAFLRQNYTTGDMIAYALDPNRAAPLIGKAFAASEVGGAASAQGLAIGKDLAENLATHGVSGDQARLGFGQVALEEPNANKLAAISGEQGFTTTDLASETFLGDSATAQRRQRLASQERGRFGGSSGVSNSSLSRTQGGV